MRRAVSFPAARAAELIDVNWAARRIADNKKMEGEGTVMSDTSEVVVRALERRRARPTQLLQILREVQEELDWISPETAHAVAAGLGIPATQVESVVQFYSFLYDQPRGRYRILFSDNITDRMLGSLTLFEHMLKRLKLRRGRGFRRRRGERRSDLLHRDVRSGPGAARQQPAGHAPDRAPGRRDLRPRARRRSARRMAGRLFPRRGQHPPRRRAARLALRARVGACGRRSRSAARACSTR